MRIEIDRQVCLVQHILFTTLIFPIMKQRLLFTLLLVMLASVDVIAQNSQAQTSPPIIRQRYICVPEDGFDLRYYDWCSIEFENTDEADVVLHYRYEYTDDWDGTVYKQDWKDFMPEWNAIVLQESAWGWVEVYAVAENKLPSDTVKESFYFNRFPMGHYQRYYDFNVNDIYYRILDESSVAVSKLTIDPCSVFDPFWGNITSDDPEWNWMDHVSTANPCYYGDLVIPATVEYKGKTYTVAAINDYAFQECDLINIQLPNTLDTIGKCAFYLTNMSSITIPDNVTFIGEGAFALCDELNEIKIPDNVSCIGAGAFVQCHSLTEVTMPSSCDTIGDAAFARCDNLASVTLNEGLEWIGAEAFADCTALTEVDIPASVTWVGRSAFSGCVGLTKVICRGIVPPEADMPFNNNEEGASGYIYENATLFVPNESLEAYRNHPEWSWFYRIVPFIGAGPGDINGDGSISVSDLTSVVNMMLSADEGIPAYCDVNGDGNINVTDVTALVNQMLNAQ